jgi:hypothetical protein
MANEDSNQPAVDQNRESYADDAKARRVLNVLDDGTVINAANPLPVDIGAGSGSSVTLKDGDSALLADIESDGTKNALFVQANDLDIRDLASGSDSVAAVQSGTWNITNVSGTVSLPTGAATSAKQLADGHNVAVSNMIPAVETGLATSAKQLADNHNVVVTSAPSTVVTATNLDIRDLTNVSDSILIYGSDDGGTTKRVVKTDSGGAIQVDLEVASVTVTSGNITADTELSAAILLADNTATPTTAPVGSFNMVYDGATWDFMRGTSADGVLVNMGANNDVTVTSGAITETNSGTIAGDTTSIDGKITACNTGAVVVASGTITTITNNVNVNLQDGTGTDITSSAGALDVNLASSDITITANIEGDYADDSTFTVASDRGLAVGGVFTTDTIDANDFGAFKISAKREQFVVQDTAADLNMTEVNSGTIAGDTTSIDGKITACNTGAVVISSGTITTVTTLTGITNDVSIDDGGNSLTIDQPTHDNLNANANIQVANTDVGAANPVPTQELTGLVPEEFDYLILTYVAAGNGAGEIETAIYKTGGAGGSTVATLTLVYDANDKISTVTRT